MYQHYVAIGRWTEDVNLQHSKQGKAYARVTLAVNSGYGDKQKSLFLPAVLFGKTAEVAAQYTRKGSKVLVEGELQQRSWEKDGRKHSVVELQVNAVKFLDRGERRNDDGDGFGSDFDPGDDSDVPF